MIFSDAQTTLCGIYSNGVNTSGHLSTLICKIETVTSTREVIDKMIDSFIPRDNNLQIIVNNANQTPLSVETGLICYVIIKINKMEENILSNLSTEAVRS